MSQKANPINKKTILIIACILLVAICLFPLFYLTIYQWANASICPYIISHRIGTEPNYLAIKQYIQNELTPGLSRNEVESRLKKVGQIKVWRNDVVLFNNVTDELHVILCFDPMDSFTIFAHYTIDGKLIKIEFDSE